MYVYVVCMCVYCGRAAAPSELPSRYLEVLLEEVPDALEHVPPSCTSNLYIAYIAIKDDWLKKITDYYCFCFYSRFSSSPAKWSHWRITVISAFSAP